MVFDLASNLNVNTRKQKVSTTLAESFKFPPCKHKNRQYPGIENGYTIKRKVARKVIILLLPHDKLLYYLELVQPDKKYRQTPSVSSL